MEQRQPRLGDILDDYCPRERRLTNHAVVAMVGAEVKQTRCTTCDAEHEFKHAKVPRQRKKAETPAALFSQVAASAPKRVVPDERNHREMAPAGEDVEVEASTEEESGETSTESGALGRDNADDNPVESSATEGAAGDADGHERAEDEEDGPVHRPLIRAALPRPEGQPPPQRPLPEFTIRQPGGRQNRFRPRNFRSGGVQGGGGQGNRSNGNSYGGSQGGSQGGSMRGGGGMRQGGGRSPQGVPPRFARRDGPGRKRSK